MWAVGVYVSIKLCLKLVTASSPCHRLGLEIALYCTIEAYTKSYLLSCTYFEKSEHTSVFEVKRIFSELSSVWCYYPK